MFNGYKTIVGIVVAAAPTIASLFGYHVAPEFGPQFADAADKLVTIVGLCFALYGRLVATEPGWFSKN